MAKKDISKEINDATDVVIPTSVYKPVKPVLAEETPAVKYQVSNTSDIQILLDLGTIETSYLIGPQSRVTIDLTEDQVAKIKDTHPRLQLMELV